MFKDAFLLMSRNKKIIHVKNFIHVKKLYLVKINTMGCQSFSLLNLNLRLMVGGGVRVNPFERSRC